jgi:hypothetical protein
MKAHEYIEKNASTALTRHVMKNIGRYSDMSKVVKRGLGKRVKVTDVIRTKFGHGVTTEKIPGIGTIITKVNTPKSSLSKFKIRVARAKARA